ncbi:MAG TPA: hypothetical protein V6C65_26240 [Allocoleopsis sp.]
MSFLNTLFDNDECIQIINRYDFKRGFEIPVEEAKVKMTDMEVTFDGQLVTLNGTKDGSTILRNLLFEIDNAGWSPEQQVQWFKDRGLPFTSMVFTGSKSVHVVISLETPVKDMDAYKRIHHAIWQALDGVPDKQTNHPGLTTKVPGGYRLKGNQKNEQKLLELRGRVTLLQLREFLAAKNCLHYLTPKPKREYRQSNAKVVGYAIAMAGDSKTQIYTECPVCGKQKLSVNTETGAFRCFIGCDYKTIRDSIDDNYGVGIEIETIKTERERENKTFHLWMDH